VAGVHVRRAQPGDWAVLRTLRLAALVDAPEAFGSTVERELAFDEAEWRRRATNTPSFIAWSGDEPVGLAAVIARPEDDGADSRTVWELVSMWVSPDVRGSGPADQLVSAVAEVVKAEPVEELTLWVADGNARARAFYVRAGFRPTGIRQTFRRHDGSAFDEEKLVMLLAAASG
jgi:ribosomal protein S18 acetylase RimI-like enzyme